MGSGSASNAIVQYLENKTILITGGSGFLAKILLEKILRIQPNVAKVYLLIRASDSNSLMHRFENEVVRKELFRVLRAKYGANFDSFISMKVVPVAGDVSYDNLGLRDHAMIEEICNKLDIIVGFAATTNFTERYDVAMGINTLGTLRVLNFAKKCVQLKMLLYVSTAYVCGEKEGISKETPWRMGETLLKDGKSNLSIEAENKLIEDKLNEMRSKHNTEEVITSTMKELGIMRARAHGWPNTYVFTKAMGEMILENYKNNVPIVILRPTMITSTIREPFSGWIEGLRTVDGVIGGYAKGIVKCMPCDPNAIHDIIPADMVINSILVAIVAHANRSSSKIIYHIGSSSKNPIKFSGMQDYFLQYFTKNPLTDKRGNPIKYTRMITFDTMEKFQKYMMTQYILPLQGLRLINIVTCQYYKDLYATSKRKVDAVIRLANIYTPYMYFKGIFDDTNAEDLRTEARNMVDDGNDGFNFDPRTIDWEDYFINVHYPSLVNNVILKKLN